MFVLVIYMGPHMNKEEIEKQNRIILLDDKIKLKEYKLDQVKNKSQFWTSLLSSLFISLLVIGLTLSFSENALSTTTYNTIILVLAIAYFVMLFITYYKTKTDFNGIIDEIKGLMDEKEKLLSSLE
jgi:hypothetical protein